MNKFKKSLFGYNTKEVNAFIDDIIKNVEKIIKSNKEKTNKIQKLENEITYLKKYPNNNLVKSEEELSKTLSDSILLTKNTTKTIQKVEDERINIIKEKLEKTIEEQKRLLEELDKK
ncbi:MAG: DivIVA domain-containing protein [Bacilli bacterium]|nr:DivIVA domain-containing protein [Bacilli bacterium]